MTTDDWGARQERSARWRRAGVLAVVGVLAGASVAVLPFVSAGHMVFGPDQRTIAAPAGVRIAAGLALLALLIGAARINWNTRDELRREELVRFWAGIGFSLCVSFVLVHILAPMLGDHARLVFVYAVSLGGGCLFWAWRQWRDRG